MEHKRGGAWYNRNKAWFLRLKPYREGKIRAPNGVREHVQQQIDRHRNNQPKTVVVYEASHQSTSS